MSAQRARDGGCPSQFLLDRLSAGELSDVERVGVEKHTAACPMCQRGLAARETERAEFTPDPRVLTRLAELSAARPRWNARRRWVAMAAPAFLCAAGLLLVLRARPSGEPSGQASGQGAPATVIPRHGNIKGGFTAKILVERDGELSVLEPAARPAPSVAAMGIEPSVDDATPPLRPGDRLQAVVRISDDRFVAVYSLDAAGTRTRYSPPEAIDPSSSPAQDAAAPAMVRLSAGGEQPLPNSTILDDVLGPEALAVFACKESHPDAALRARVVEGELEGCEVARFFAVKAAR